MPGRPPVELSIEGQGLAALQRKFKADGSKILQRELNKRLRAIGQDCIAPARSAARSNLPSTGGLNDRIASAPMRVTISSSKREPGVKIVVKGHDARATNSGRLRHPVYGNREVWVTQQVKPGWFTDAMMGRRDEARRQISAALEETAQKIASA